LFVGADSVQNLYWTSRSIDTSQSALLEFTIADWMSKLKKDDTPLSELILPGTHDSYSSNSRVPQVFNTQTITITNQLQAGIRFFDLRCSLNTDKDGALKLVMCHSIIPLRVPRAQQTAELSDALGEIYDYLTKYPKEAIVVSIKNDGADNTNFGTEVFNVINANIGFWRLDDTEPTLGALRGKIQLFRRFADDVSSKSGFDLSVWRDNDSFSISTPHKNFYVQDLYAFANISRTDALITKQNAFRKAYVDGEKNSWVINFSSIASVAPSWPNNWDISLPYNLAHGDAGQWKNNNNMNKFLLENVDSIDGIAGIIAIDFVESGSVLLEKIIQLNFKN